MCWLVVMALLSGGQDPAPASGRSRELARLAGHKVRLVPPDDYEIVDVAGEGRPIVGTVEMRGKRLWLIGPGAPLELSGPLAQPRIAGPGYKVWVLGNRRGQALEARRLGVLAPPAPTISP